MEASRIGDSEMRRINIEASAALSRLLQIRMDDFEGYRKIIYRARRLPLPRLRPVPLGMSYLAALVNPNVVQAIRGRATTKWGRLRVEQAKENPLRVFANSIVNYCWRNGPIEDVHAGRIPIRTLLRRRLTEEEEASIFGTLVARLAQTLPVVAKIVGGNKSSLWQRVLPFNLAPEFCTPTGWSLGLNTCDVTLSGPETPPWRNSPMAA
jgi:hypothetical protein